MLKTDMLFIFTLLFISATSGLVLADGCFVTDNHSEDVYAPDQKVVINWDGRIETMILSTKLQSSVLANVGWIIPIQAMNKPEVELGDIQVFYVLSDYFKPIREEILKSVPAYAILGVEIPELDTIEVLESKKLDIYNITILKAGDPDQLYKWLKVNNFVVPERAKSILQVYTKKDFFFITVKLDLLNEYQDDIELIKKHALFDLVRLAVARAPAPLRSFGPPVIRPIYGGIVDSFQENSYAIEENSYAIAYSIISHVLSEKTYPRGLQEYIGPVEFTKLKGEYSVTPHDFNLLNNSLRRLCKIMIDLKQGVAKPLKIVFKTKRPFFPLKISQMNAGNVQVTAYVFSEQPLKDESGIMEISRLKELTKGIRNNIKEYLDIGRSKYVSKLIFEGHSSDFTKDTYLGELNKEEVAANTDIYESFYQAIQEGDIEFVKEHVDSLPNINERWAYYTPLDYSMKMNKTKIAKILLEKGAIFNNSDSSTINSLLLAIASNKVELVRLFLDKGADINVAFDLPKNRHAFSTSTFTGSTPLHSAVYSNIEIVKLLLAKGANVDAVDGFNNTPLHKAVEQNEIEILKLLVEHGANIEARNNNGATPLICAADFSALESNIEIMKLLPARGINAELNSRIEILELLVARGINTTDAVERFYNTLLHKAAKRGKIGMVKLLVEHGANIEARNNNGATPLICIADSSDTAVYSNIGVLDSNTEIMKLLLARGANVDAVDGFNNTALHKTARRSNIEMVKLLVEHGANIDARNNDGATPLICAAGSPYEPIDNADTVRYLLEKGADINVTNKHNKTALDEAKKKGKKGIIALLEEKQK